MVSNMKKIACLAAILTCGGVSAQAVDRLDSTLEALAKCSSSSDVAPSLAAYRLLLSSKVVVREKRGPVTIYSTPFESRSGSKIWGLLPTKIVVVEREGFDVALVGSLFSSDFPMNSAQIIDSFKGGLKRKIDMRLLARETIGGFRTSSVEVSTEPVFQSSHLVNVKLASGERVVFCARLQQIETLLAR